MAAVCAKQAVSKIGIDHRHLRHGVGNDAGARHHGHGLVDYRWPVVTADVRRRYSALKSAPVSTVFRARHSAILNGDCCTVTGIRAPHLNRHRGIAKDAQVTACVDDTLWYTGRLQCGNRAIHGIAFGDPAKVNQHAAVQPDMAVTCDFYVAGTAIVMCEMADIQTRQETVADELASGSDVEKPVCAVVKVSGDAQHCDSIGVHFDRFTRICLPHFCNVAVRFVERHYLVDAFNLGKACFNRGFMSGRYANLDDRSKPRPCAANEITGFRHRQALSAIALVASRRRTPSVM